MAKELRVITDGSVASFVQTHIQGCEPFTDPIELGVYEDDTLLFGVVFDKFGVDDDGQTFAYMNVAKAADNWATQTILEELFSYAFDTKKWGYLLAAIELTNTEAQALATDFGYVVEEKSIGDFAFWKLTPQSCNYYGE